jgi:ABC-2 type transport system permease protein
VVVILAALSLCRRELVRFFRQRSRVVGALGTPVVFWILIGSGFNYLDYLFPGTIIQILLFASIFSTISIIQDRNEGFLQGVLVAPVPRAAVVLGKVMGGSTIALLQGLAFLCLGPTVHIRPSGPEIALAVGAMTLVAFGLTSMGVIFAWRFNSVQGFHGVMNLLLFPMWLLSGAVFPPDKATRWIQWAMWANPLTYGVASLRWALGGAPGMALGLSWGITGAFAGVMFLLASATARR